MRCFPASSYLVLPAVLALASCDQATKGTARETPAPKVESEGFVVDRATYVVHDGLLVLDRGSVGSDTIRECTTGRGPDAGWTEDSLAIEIRERPRFDTLIARISGSDLILHFGMDTTREDAFATRFRRLGEGTGLMGEWRAEEYRLRDSGAWIPNGRGYLAKVVDSRVILTERDFQWVLRERVSWATSKVLDWNYSLWTEDAPSSFQVHDIVATAVDSETVQYRGNRTYELVQTKRIRPSPRSPHSGDVRVTSSFSSHETYVLEEILRTCPDEPTWFRSFRYDNTRTSASP